MLKQIIFKHKYIITVIVFFFFLFWEPTLKLLNTWVFLENYKHPFIFNIFNFIFNILSYYINDNQFVVNLTLNIIYFFFIVFFFIVFFFIVFFLNLKKKQ